ncbi:MAG TPA: radical SAM family heme chaperone HemW [Pirellulaceae bacterium]|nr:radical SAM family heme chaperone HemW [Pirellulaceae bacterium]HMO92519.1 radical SAM family heme chaperone HemW [Pirellulaceae bacterium]HMP68998.1 radical SAM family heme chaperone HemW [Pirellulaceae bacterium]
MNFSDAKIPAPTSVYVHVPFCRQRCGYCNFALVADRDYLIKDFLTALESEMMQYEATGAIDTLFLGGGTPTLLDGDALTQLCESIFRRFKLRADGEFSIEANPNDLDSDKIKCLRDLGVNRLSLGAQSFNALKLDFLERDHDAAQIYQAIDLSRAHFESISLDLMFGVRGETAEVWQTDLDTAISTQVQHISTYELTIEKGTQFWNRTNRRERLKTNENNNAKLYLLAQERLTRAGFHQYEISNFAQPQHACRHNQAYWNGSRYWAFGPGAASFVGNTRRINHAGVIRYIRELKQGRLPLADQEHLTHRQIGIDMLVFGLRQVSGCNLMRWQEFSGLNVQDLPTTIIDRFIDAGWISLDSTAIRLTQSGLLFADAICSELFTAMDKIRGQVK